jgi:hypothetical protein
MWTAPRTWVTGEVVTAALLNTHVRDNLVDLDRRTVPIGTFVNTAETTTSTSYTDLATAGPAATATIGATLKALVSLRGELTSTSGSTAYASVAISGATTVAASDSVGIGHSFTGPATIRLGMTVLYSSALTAAGSTTFTAKYRTAGGTMTANNRGLTVQPLGS